jgi:hypothetical protein
LSDHCSRSLRVRVKPCFAYDPRHNRGQRRARGHISELDETNPYVKELLVAVGLDLNPVAVRCMVCNEVCAADASVCGCCGASIAAQWVNGTD